MYWQLEIHHIDVGRGDATLFVVNGRQNSTGTWTRKKAVLLDCGYGWATLGCVIPYLKKQNIKELDLLIFSHAHGDHCGGYAKLSEFVTSSTGKLGNESTCNKLDGFKLPQVDEDILGFNESSAPKMYCVSNELPDMLDEDAKLNNDQENRSSLAFVILFAGYRYYTAGDLDGDTEVKLSDHIEKDHGEVHFYKVAHHGSKNSSSDKFLETMKPRYAFISCGDDGTTKQHDHPTQSCLDRLWAPKNHVQQTFMTSCSLLSDHVQSNPEKYQKGKMIISGGLGTTKNAMVKGHIALCIDSTWGNNQTVIVGYYDNARKKNVYLKRWFK